MSETTFADLMRQMRLHYDKKEYAQALEIHQQIQFPQDRQWLMYHWRMCLTALLNDADQAIQAFRDALERGYWFAPSLVTDDEDLKSLQELPEYKQLVEVSRQRFTAVESTKPEMLVIPPERGMTERVPLLIGLHGNAQNARVASENWNVSSAKEWLLALPRSTQAMASDAYMWNDFARGTQEVQQHYATLSKEYHVDPERVIIGGFSMGAGLALHLAVTGAIPARGFVVVGLYVPDTDVLLPYLEAARERGLRGYMVMGMQESAQGLENMRKILSTLETYSIPCEVEQHPDLGHAFSIDFAKSLEKALAFIL